MFEFCLHEMREPGRALEHARTLAPDVVVIDHAPGSPWSWSAAEDASVEAGWAAVASLPVRRQAEQAGLQRFQNFATLEAKLAQQGPESRERIATYRGRTDIAIPMPYRLVLF